MNHSLPPTEYGGDQGLDEPPPRDEVGAEPRVWVPAAPPAVDVPSLRSPVQEVPRVPPRSAAEARQPSSVVAAVRWKTFQEVSREEKTLFVCVWRGLAVVQKFIFYFIYCFFFSFYFWMVIVILLELECYADAALCAQASVELFKKLSPIDFSSNVCVFGSWVNQSPVAPWIARKKERVEGTVWFALTLSLLVRVNFEKFRSYIFRDEFILFYCSTRRCYGQERIEDRRTKSECDEQNKKKVAR